MYIEDLLERLACSGNYFAKPYIPVSLFDKDIIKSLAEQIMSGKSFTQKQRNLVLKIIKKYSKTLSNDLSIDVIELVNNPNFRMPLRTVVENRSIIIEKDSNNITKIFVRFPYDNSIVESIKDYRHRLPRLESTQIYWNSTVRAWEFGFSECNIQFLSGLLLKQFTADETFLEIYKEIQQVEQNIERYVPMVVSDNNIFKFKNTFNTVPEYQSDNLIDILIKARRHGIEYWDDTVNDLLKSGNYSENVITFFENTLELNKNSSLLDITDLIKYSDNVLFIIPGGNELKTVSNTHSLLKKQGATNKDISILFRLDNALGKKFNEYVKDNSLNEPITDQTKYFFISGKVPKPLLESNRYFDLVVQFGVSNVHYSLKNFVKTHHNVIYIGKTALELDLA